MSSAPHGWVIVDESDDSIRGIGYTEGEAWAQNLQVELQADDPPNGNLISRPATAHEADCFGDGAYCAEVIR